MITPKLVRTVGELVEILKVVDGRMEINICFYTEEDSATNPISGIEINTHDPHVSLFAKVEKECLRRS